MPPLATPSVPEIVESVVDAVHVGIPLRYARMYPAVPVVVVESAPVPLPYGIALAAMLAHPVPPFAIGRIPVTSLARSTSAVVTAPATAFKNPVTLEKVNELDATRAEVEAVPVTPRLVLVALTSVVAPVTPSVPATERFPAESMVVVAVPPK